MKKMMLALLLSFLLSSYVNFAKTNAYAASFLPDTPVCITVNGNYIKTEYPAFLEKGHTMVPLRTICDALSADSVLWDAKSKTATIQKEAITLSVTQNKKTAILNQKNVVLDAPATIVKDRFYVPLRFISETFSAVVKWDKETYTAHITASDTNVPSSLIGKKPYLEDDLYWLSKIVHAESRGEPMRGKIGVANVVLNRVKSDAFDDTVYEVIFDKKHGVQFSPTIDGSIYQTPLGDSIVAAKRALLGENTVGNSLYFLNPDVAESFWIVKNRPYHSTIENHDFYL